METLRSAKTALAARDFAALKRLEAHVKGSSGTDDPRVFLSTVILSLAARGRIRLFEVLHRPGFASRLLGKSPSAAFHVAESGPDRENEGAVEVKLLAGVRTGIGPKAPHGPALRRVIESLFRSAVRNPGAEIMTAAKEDAIGRGVGRWIPDAEIPRLADSRGGLVDGLLEVAFERGIRGARFYEILPGREPAVASEVATLRALRTEISAGDTSRLEDEIEKALDARTYVPD